MTRNLFSYWLTVRPNHRVSQNHSLTEILETLDQSYLAGESDVDTMVFNVNANGDELTGEINPDIGAIEEDTRLAEELDKIATKFPDYIFLFDENDEEDHANAIHTEWFNGIRVKTEHARVIEPGGYDKQTINDILEFLREHHENYVADMIVRQFVENHTNPLPDDTKEG